MTDSTREQFCLITKKYHLNIVPSCRKCGELKDYLKDVERIEQHWKTINRWLNNYMTNDPAGIITNYMSEKNDFLCHFCEVLNYFGAILKTFSKAERHIAQHNFENVKTDYIKVRQRKKYLVVKRGDIHISYHTYLRDDDIYKLLVLVGELVNTTEPKAWGPSMWHSVTSVATRFTDFNVEVPYIPMYNVWIEKTEMKKKTHQNKRKTSHYDKWSKTYKKNAR